VTSGGSRSERRWAASGWLAGIKSDAVVREPLRTRET
jgi:hypothetical protein